jgi:small GTP-binding protein
MPKARRVVLIGNSGVGKTSIVSRFTQNSFDDCQEPTIGATYQTVIRQVAGGTLQLQIWDTAGQEKYKALGTFYYQNAVAAIVVFDVTDPASFDALPEWIEAFHQVVGTEGLVYVVANKIDLVEDTVVLTDDAADWAEKKGYTFYSVSAKTGESVQPLVDHMANAIAQKVAMTTADVSPIETPAPQSSCC